MKVKVKMPGNYARHIITEPGKSDVMAKADFEITPYDDDERSPISSLATKMSYGPEFYKYITRILPREAARRGEGILFSGEVGEPKPKHKIDLPDTYFGHPIYDYYGGMDEDYGYLGSGSARHPKNVPGFQFSIYKGWQDPQRKRYQDSAERKSKILTNILNNSKDFSPLLGPIAPYKDPSYPWDEYPEGDVKVKSEDYNRKLRSRIDQLEHELKYTSNRNPRDPEEILAEIEDLKSSIDKGFAPAPGHERIPIVLTDPKTGKEKKVFIPIPHTLNMPLYNWNSRLFDFNYDTPEKIWQMFSRPDSKSDWGIWGLANAVADYEGNIDESYNTNKPYNYLVENSKLVDKGYFDDIAKSRSISGDKSKAPEAEGRVFRLNDITQTPEYHNNGTDKTTLTNMKYTKNKPDVVIYNVTGKDGQKIARQAATSLEDKGVSGKDRIHQELRVAKGKEAADKLRQSFEDYKKKHMTDNLTQEEKRKALASYVQNRVNSGTDATITKGKTGERAQTRGDINQEIKEKLNFQKKLANKLGMDKSKLLPGKANIFIQEGIEPTDENVDAIKSIARDMWQTFEDEGIEDDYKKWGLVGREFKRRQDIIDKNTQKDSDDKATMQSILKGITGVNGLNY